MQIVDMQPEHAEVFRDLNLAWIGANFTVEAKDRATLENPQAAILDQGGHVLMALDGDGQVLGCAALLLMADGGFELAKMTTAQTARGRGVARMLIEAAAQRAQSKGAPRLYLETNSVLAPALALYRATGFVDLPAQPTPYARADVFMERRF